MGLCCMLSFLSNFNTVLVDMLVAIIQRLISINITQEN